VLGNCALPTARLPVKKRPEDSLSNPQFLREGKQDAAGQKEAATHSSRSCEPSTQRASTPLFHIPHIF